MDKLNKKVSKSGITLIALVITIIVLLILAGISLNLILGNNGVVQRAVSAKLEYEKAEKIETVELAVAAAKIAGNGELLEENLNNELKKAFNDTAEIEKKEEKWYYKGYTIDTSGNVEKYSSLLPSEYQEVKYIESTGTEYIDTNFTFTKFTRIKTKFRTPETIDRTKTNTLFYAGDDNNVFGFAINATSNDGKYKAFNRKCI